MDPITALSLASTILTFVDYAHKIVTGTYEIYQSVSGVTEDNAHVDIIVSDFNDIATDLVTTVPGKSPNEIALKDLASKCEAISGRLLALLNSLKVSGHCTTWKSLKAKIKSMRKENEILSIEKQLGDYRGQILTRLTMMLR